MVELHQLTDFLQIDGRCMLDTLTYRSGRVLQRPGSWFPQPIRPAAVSRIPHSLPPSPPMYPTGYAATPWQQQQQQMQMQQMQARQYGAILPPNGIPLDSEDEDFSPNSFKSMTTVPEDLMWLLPPTLAGFDFGTKVRVLMAEP